MLSNIGQLDESSQDVRESVDDKGIKMEEAATQEYKMEIKVKYLFSLHVFTQRVLLGHMIKLTVLMVKSFIEVFFLTWQN
jgi:hypothetical protein